jgi:hypothetical protein
MMYWVIRILMYYEERDVLCGFVVQFNNTHALPDLTLVKRWTGARRTCPDTAGTFNAASKEMIRPLSSLPHKRSGSRAVRLTTGNPSED